MATINIPDGWVKDQSLNALTPAPLAEWDQPGQHMRVLAAAAKPAGRKPPAAPATSSRHLELQKMNRAQLVQVIKDYDLGPGSDGSGGINPDSFPTVALLREAILEAVTLAVKAHSTGEAAGK